MGRGCGSLCGGVLSGRGGRYGVGQRLSIWQGSLWGTQRLFIWQGDAMGEIYGSPFGRGRYGRCAGSLCGKGNAMGRVNSSPFGKGKTMALDLAGGC